MTIVDQLDRELFFVCRDIEKRQSWDSDQFDHSKIAIYMGSIARMHFLRDMPPGSYTFSAAALRAFPFDTYRGHRLVLTDRHGLDRIAIEYDGEVHAILWCEEPPALPPPFS